MEGLQHFCIYGEDILYLLIKKYKPTMVGSVDLKIDWKHIFSSESDNKFIFIRSNNGWNYLIWNNYSVNKTITFIKDISKTLDTSINYYFVDGQIDAARWILSDKGKIIKGFCYQMGEIEYNLGYNQSEIDAIIAKAYSEFWDIYERTTQPIPEINENEYKIYYGQF